MSDSDYFREDWKDVRRRFRLIMNHAKLLHGRIYRAVTFDNDIVDGKLTYSSCDKFELQTGSQFRSFNRSVTRLHLIENDY